MKKRILTAMLALTMLMAFIPTAFAAKDIPSSSVKVPASIQVRKDGTDDAWETSKNLLTLKTSEMTEPVDFLVKLNTTPLKNAITEWYEYGESLIADIAGDNETLKSTLTAHFNEWSVTGEFTVVVKFPTQLSGASLTEHFRENRNDMYGFNEEAKALFEETARSIGVEGNDTVLTISLSVKDVEGDGEAGIIEQSLYDGVKNGTYLNELIYTVEDVIPGEFKSSLTVDGKLEGYTSFQIGSSSSASDNVEFYTDTVRATLKKPTSAPSGTGDDSFTIRFNIDGHEDYINVIYADGSFDAVKLPTPEKPGFTFDGWYTDAEMTVKATGKLTKSILLYGHWVSELLDTENHFAYIIGYPDGTVRPEKNITREEATMIFYRLLRDNVRDGLYTLENDFSDIKSDRWSNSALSTMANGGYVTGRPDGKFDPEAPITRAEFATMAVRFGDLMDTSDVSFNDIGGHWAESYILKAAKEGWISGYPDGSFKPDTYITRAEAMTLVNNVLARKVDEAGLHSDTTRWIDMKGDEWFYHIVLEATNSHDYKRTADGITEIWKAILPNKTWK